MTTIPDAATIAAANAYVAGECPTISGRMRAALEAALPYLPTVESLGLFTHPDHPGYVGLPNSKHGEVVVWEKGSALTLHFTPKTASINYAIPKHTEFAAFARAYYAAHPEPEPKPWEDAKPGEVWVLVADGEERVFTVGENVLTSLNKNSVTIFPKKSDKITSGYRIWKGVVNV